MARKPTYEELEQRVNELEKEALKRNRVEELLRGSEEKYQTILDSIEEGYYEVDIAGNFTFFNDAMCKIRGCPRDELMGMNNRDYMTEKAAKKVYKAFNKVYTTGKPAKNLGWETIRPNGSKRFEETSASLMKGSKGEPIGFRGVVRDVTERKQAEGALRESENIFSLFMEHSPIYVFFKDENIRSIRLSRNYEQMLGRPLDELLGKTMDELFPSDLAKVMIADDLRILNEGKPITIEEEFNERFYETTKFPILIDGKPKYLAGYTIDITERKRSEEALQESEEKYRILFEKANIAISVVQDGIIKSPNPKLLDLHGCSEEEITSIPFIHYIHPEDREMVQDRHERRLRGEEFPTTYSYRIFNKAGDTKWVELNVVPILWEGKPAILCFLTDITERLKIEESLRESEERLARSRKMESMGLLAGGVAHDLNNVLSGIVSYPELLLLDLPEDSKLRKPIETIKESGDRAAAIVQDLLTVARGVATTKEPLNLNDLVNDYLNSPEFKKLEQFHSTVTIKTNLDTDLLNVSGSDVHIKKVVMNLVSNASEATKRSGNVTISTMNRYIDRPLKGYDDVNIGEYALLAISDDGSGISSDDLERIFEPFYTKKVMGRSGTGLGLAVVWNVVQDHKSYIDVITDENGTTFELYFPITRDEVSDKDLSISIKDYKGDGETILVIDDMENQREISSNMLDALGYKTKAVSSGEEAFEYLKENTVDLILLDMIMDPGINGRETYERIIKIHPNQKAIIVSGFAETDEVKEAQKLGAGQYIKKPLTLEMIGLAVKEELEK